MHTLTLSIKKEFEIWKQSSSEKISQLNSGSASNRKYFRLKYNNHTYIACYNEDLRENEAFFYLAKYFREKKINIPQVYYISNNRKIYFQQDLGDSNLLQKLKSIGLTKDIESLYQKSLRMLWQMQSSAKSLNFNKCYPRASFDTQSVLWDLNYFKYYFLKVSGITFDEQLLEDDFQFLAQLLSVGENEDFFMFRDFQARNIQIWNDDVWFIDFQGGRRGPVLYDVASILFQASANLPQNTREDLVNYYYHQIAPSMRLTKKVFLQKYQLMIFIRVIQVLGAYGYRGLIEKKEYFKKSIPNALKNLQFILPQIGSFVKIPYFLTVLNRLVKIKNNFDQ